MAEAYPQGLECSSCRKPNPEKKCLNSQGTIVSDLHMMCKGKRFCNEKCERKFHNSSRKKLQANVLIEETPKIKCQSSDGDVFDVELRIVQQFKNFDSKKPNETLVLSEVDASTLIMVIWVVKFERGIKN